MREPRRCAGGFALLLLLTAIGRPLRAEAPPDPLRYVPEQADLFVKIDDPRRLIEAVTNLQPLRQLQQFQAVQEYYASTNQKRFLQLLAYVEKELGMKWPAALDRLAGGGAVAAVKFGPNPAPAGLAVQGKDKELLQKFVRLAASFVEQELARQESTNRLEKGTYRGVEVYQVGKEFHAAAVDTTLFAANRVEVLRLLIENHLDGKKGLAESAGVTQARQLLPARPLVWGWLNLETIRQAPQAKEVFAQPRNDPFLTVGFGGWLDVARRSSFLCGALYQDDSGRLVTSFRMPQGREGMPPELATHIPPAEGLGSLPLLEPKGVVFSSSSYFDVGKFWEYRTKLFNAQQVKSFEDADKQSGLFLLGNPLHKLLTQAGAHQRFVVVHRDAPAEPKGERNPLRSLAFGLVLDVRDKGFSRSVETLARGAGLIARSQVKVTLVEEKYGDVNVLGFRFPENDTATTRAANAVIAYLPTPSLALAGDQVVLSSSLELCKELIDLVRREARNPDSAKKTDVSSLSRVYSQAGADLLKVFEDQLYAQTVLNQALAPAEAKEQVQRFVEWVRGLGRFEIEEWYGAQDFHYDLIYAPK